MAICRSDIAAEIKAALTMEEVVERYSFTPDRGGYIHCPFHQGDNHGSLKIYAGQRGWNCFGCGRGGSVIDFVMQLFDLPFRAACAKLNDDFTLGLSMDKPGRTEMSHAVRRRQAEARRREDEKQKEAELFTEECRLTAEINRAEIAMQEHPPRRDGWDTFYPAEWLEAAGKLDGLKLELLKNDYKKTNT